MNLTLIFKKFRHQKTNALLRIVSLGLGMGGALVLFYIVRNKLTVDQFYPGHSRIYSVFAYYKSPNGSDHTNIIYQPVAPALVSNFPQIRSGTVVYDNSLTTFKNKESLISTNAIYADSSFFKVFQRPFLLGNAEHSLTQLNTAVITRKFARKLFGNENSALGKIIFLNQIRPIQITGVIKNWPDNSSFDAGIIISFATLKDEHLLYMGWNGGDSFRGYVKLARHVKPTQIDDAIHGLLQKYYNEKAAEAKGYYTTFKLIPLTKTAVTAYPDQKKTTSIMILIGVLVIGLAIFNSLILILSGKQKFHKEIFIQRTLGASGSNIQKLIFQETLVYMIASSVVTTSFIFLINPFIETYYQINLLHAFTNVSFLLLAVLIFCVSFVIIYWIPVRWAIRYFTSNDSSQYVSRTPVNAFLQRALLTLQIGISFSLFIFLWVIQSQFNFISHFNQGYNPNNLIYINLSNKLLYSKDQVIKNEIAKLPNVLSSCLSDDIPVFGFGGNEFQKSPDAKNEKDFRNLSVGSDFFHTLKIKMKGPGFNPNSTNKNSVVVTENVVKAFDLKSPIGKIIYRYRRPFTIRGVVPDIVSGSIHQLKLPIVFNHYDTPSAYSILTVRIDSLYMKNTIYQIKKTIEKIVPGQIVQVNYYESDIKSNYENDIAMKKTVSFFALFAAFITLAGLVGFTTTMIERRTKELGIRKINGASEQSLMLLLNKTFAVNLVIAILIFVPVSYHVTKMWLQNFAYSIQLRAGIFVLISILVSVVVLTVVTVLTLKAARRNPAETLRYE